MHLPALVGIVNVTPDSFSDGGRFADPDAALVQAEALIDAGASVIDVGAESTRPDAQALTSAEEWSRLEPLWSDMVALCKRRNVALSLDSYHPETVERALKLGCDIVNDVRGGEETAMRAMLAEHSCRIVVMHALSIPADKAVTLPPECDVIKALRAFFMQRIEEYEQSGIARARLMLDPGIGFGKSARQSYDIMQRIDELNVFDLPLYVGHSRKSFLRLFAASDAALGLAERDALSAAFALQLARAGVSYLRVHNVQQHRLMFDRYDAQRISSLAHDG